MRRMSRKLLAGTVVLGASILFAVFRLSTPKGIYSVSVSEFLAHPLRERFVRVQGTLVHGSLCRRTEPCAYEFALMAAPPEAIDSRPRTLGSELSVRYARCVLPDTLRDLAGMDVQITIEGELCSECHRFQASQLLVRDSWYWQKRRGEHDGSDGGGALLELPPMPDCTGS